MPRIRLFAAARDAAGTGTDTVPGTTVGEVLDGAVARYGPRFAEVLATAKVWVDGEPAERDDPVGDEAEVAVLPPVSGGAVGAGSGGGSPSGATAPPATPPGSTVAPGPTAASASTAAPPSAPVPDEVASGPSASGPGASRGARTATRRAATAGRRSRRGRPTARAGGVAADGATPRPGPAGADPTLLVERLFAPADTAGHKALLGLAWVLVQALALLLGPLALAVVFGLVAAVAGLHAARAWRQARVRPSRAVAGLAPLAVPLAAVHSPGAAGVVVLVATAASAASAATGRSSRGSLVRSTATTVRCWLGPAMAAMSVVLVAAIDWQAAGALLVLVAGYDVGAYLWGSASDGPVVGRILGIITVAVLSFALGVVQLVLGLAPFQSMGAVLVFGGMVACLAPLGQLAASAILPAAAADAPALRRLDSLLLAGPAWVFALWGYVS